MASPKETINLVFKKMGSFSRKVLFPGICLIIDKDYKLIGTVTDGDIRRAFADKISFDKLVSSIMNSKPVTLPEETPEEMIIPLASEKLFELKNKTEIVKYLILVNNKGQVSNVIDLLDFMSRQGTNFQTVSVIGLGFVGITLAVTLANQGHKVIGIDSNKKYVQKLNQFDIDIYEPSF